MGCNSKDSNREFRSLSEDSNREFRSLSAFCKKFFWFSEIKEGGGCSVYGGGGVRSSGIVEKRGWGRLTCCGLILRCPVR